METEDSPESADIPGQNVGQNSFELNDLISSFTQVSSTLPIGSPIQSSQYGGAQTFTDLTIIQDQANAWMRLVAVSRLSHELKSWLFSCRTQTRETGGWGSTVNKLDIGRDHYSLHCYQTLTQWLGEARFSAPFNTPTPEMGSGHHPSEGLWKVASMTHLRASLPFSSTMFVDPDNYDSFFVRRTRMLRCNLR
ncbi:hypothetical protein CDL15_Pgr028098 [Punica granatum]|uniref:Neprosin PEP catalytic domain-containing protein n=1 Tax=Punica granatum TaxID=22663 RepID=A0A218XLF5_PUNGR|nr:hypothetical protein CDL15_Pgr028098 [Punica granatum]